MEGPRPRASEKFLKMTAPTNNTTTSNPQYQNQQVYESGLEVAEPNAWNRTNNDIHLPEVSPYNHSEAKTTTFPEVADDPLSWHHYHKQNPNLEVSSSPSVASAAPYYYAAAGQQHPPGYHKPPPGSPGYGSGSLDGDGSGKGKKATVCGMRRKVCYVVMGVAIVLVVAAIAVGLGVGLAMKKSENKSSSGPQTSNSTTTPATSTANATITCPAADNVTYSSPDAPKRTFRMICGHDFNSADGATDLTSENATTMAACIDLCASKGDDCVGAGWGDYYGNHVCWMKSKLGTMNVSGNWYFAVDVNKTSVAA
ncbi:hypothetical protein CLIM01_07910 [Colletotrichum limetticola]|uniref:Apple domain-containing protein n=1 Tax=Colletotrichum limetticola TaxID=1209924 RepID=A0ABQ9PT12_9PEZI|nr:hypothetical protein CLIM01_07910 [Colletotrichum limetticola]